MNSFVALAATTVNSGFSALSSYLDFDTNFKGCTPTAILTIGIVGTFALQALHRYTQPRWGEGRAQQIGRLLLNSRYATNKLNEKIDREYQRELKSTLRKWEPFGIPFTEIPKEGLTSKKLVKLTEFYSKIIFNNFQGKHISGTIYSNNFVEERESKLFDNMEGILNVIEEKLNCADINDRDHFTLIAEKLEILHTYAAHVSHLWNSLHQNEFGIGDFISYQVVRMVASMYGGAPDEVMGLVTTGGTDSLMTAARVYRNWGIDTYGHAPGEGVIVAPRSVHAAIEKSGMAYLLKVEYVDVNECGVVDLKSLDAALKRHGNKVVMVVGSAPEYSSGCVNQILEMAQRAYRHGCGMHVDNCLGGFIIKDLDQHNTDYLKIDGVTSISCDTHKNGQAPKGSSVLVMKDLLAKYSIYSIPGWDGGVYGTPSDAGSQPCTAALNALLSMLAIGQNGYERIAKHIHTHAIEFAETIQSFKGKLRLLDSPQVNVVAFTIDEKWQIGKGAIYAFAHEMDERGFTFNTMPGDRLHFCITLRYSCDKDVNEKLKCAVKESLDVIQEMENKGEVFPGDAGMYCSLGKALKPNTNDSIQDCIENFFLGTRGASEAVKAHFIASFDPHRKKSPYARI